MVTHHKTRQRMLRRSPRNSCSAIVGKRKEVTGDFSCAYPSRKPRLAASGVGITKNLLPDGGEIYPSRRHRLGSSAGSPSSSSEKGSARDSDECPATQPEVVDLGILSDDSDDSQDEADEVGVKTTAPEVPRHDNCVNYDALTRMVLTNWAATKFQKVKFLNEKYFDPSWERNVIVEAKAMVGGCSGDNSSDSCGMIKAFLLSKFNSLREYFVVKVREAVIECRKWLLHGSFVGVIWNCWIPLF